MFSATIHVLSSHYPVYSVTSRNHCATNEVFVGLIMQFHYVGLDKIPEQPHTVVQPVQSETIATAQAEQLEQVSDNGLDDAPVAEGEEHRRQISGAPQASMMFVKILKALDISCVALALAHQLKERNH